MIREGFIKQIFNRNVKDIKPISIDEHRLLYAYEINGSIDDIIRGYIGNEHITGYGIKTMVINALIYTLSKDKYHQIKLLLNLYDITPTELVQPIVDRQQFDNAKVVQEYVIGGKSKHVFKIDDTYFTVGVPIKFSLTHGAYFSYKNVRIYFNRHYIQLKTTKKLAHVIYGSRINNFDILNPKNLSEIYEVPHNIFKLVDTNPILVKKMLPSLKLIYKI